ncbi:MAG: ribonuclease [Clostridiales bacterium]|nr:ribonuclease [Clostridiales bacterium]
MLKKGFSVIVLFALLLSFLSGCMFLTPGYGNGFNQNTAVPEITDAVLPVVGSTEDPGHKETPCPVSEDGRYDTVEEVALYIHLFGHLPPNYITKQKAQELGWSGGGLERYAPGCAIGGDRFGNYEGLLPAKPGRYYTECDIGTVGKNSRGKKRIVFSNDGLIYYTEDHYDSFTLLYGGDGQ